MRLKENEQRFRELFDNMGTGAAIYKSPDNGQSFIFMDLNKSGLDNAKKKKEEVIGYEVRQVFPGVEELGLFDVFKRVWKTGKPEHHPSSLYTDGQLELWVENYVCKLSSGELVAIYDDTTGRKKAEAEKEILEKQIRQSQKMESIGRLAGGVAHDYNNALSVIMGFTELAMTDMESTDPLYTDLNEVIKAAKRATDITRQLLTFARKQTISPRVLDLNDNVESMLKMLQRLIGEDIDLAWLPETKIWSVKMDPSQIDQILANLCVNARDAITGVGKITIETKNMVFDTAYCSDHVGFVPGEFVLMVVSDNGSGMDKEILNHIFEPFFTTKDVDKGTGLGLSTVYGIIKQNNGFINVYSDPGEGTSINIYLPRDEGDVLESNKEGKEETPQEGEETILLVEDDLPVLKLTEKILTGMGYTVLTAGTPDEAMNLAKEHTGKVHLVITDVIMPEMNGRELSERLESICPDLKCMFMSGYTADAIAHHGVLDKGVCFIQKPFSKKDLATIVRKALDEN
jgi:signal transduction histidine kinase/CheY-like chemotaxis protein